MPPWGELDIIIQQQDIFVGFQNVRIVGQQIVESRKFCAGESAGLSELHIAGDLADVRRVVMVDDQVKRAAAVLPPATPHRPRPALKEDGKPTYPHTRLITQGCVAIPSKTLLNHYPFINPI